jgi:hypothetical protein
VFCISNTKPSLREKEEAMTHNRVYALYRTFENAATVANKLISGGFDAKHVSVITHDPEEQYARYTDIDGDGMNDDMTGDEGAGFGALVGALTGLTVALVPGFGPVIAAGPLAAVIMGGIGAATGAATGGLVASLMDFGASPENAAHYQEVLHTGGALVIVDMQDGSEEAQIREIVAQHDPINIEFETNPI